AGEQKPVPERKPSLSRGRKDRGAPRESLEGDIREDRVANLGDALCRRDALPGLLAVVQVGRAVKTAREHRLAAEEKRQQSEQEGDSRARSAEDPPRDEDRTGRRDGIGQPERQDVPREKPPSGRVTSCSLGASSRWRAEATTSSSSRPTGAPCRT